MGHAGIDSDARLHGSLLDRGLAEDSLRSTSPALVYWTTTVSGHCFWLHTHLYAGAITRFSIGNIETLLAYYAVNKFGSYETKQAAGSSHHLTIDARLSTNSGSWRFHG